MKKFYSLLTGLLVLNTLSAQTWNGSAGNNWNVAANWGPAIVPGWGSAVSIPNTINKPTLDSSVRVASITMSPASRLNFNGFTLTVSGNFDFHGAELNNSDAGTDIVLTLLNGGGTNYFRSNTIADNITINYNGAGPFYEAYTGGNIYNGHTIYNIGGMGLFYLCFDNRSTFNGNLTVNRTMAGSSEIFRVGVMAVTGNFSYINNAGGNTNIGTGSSNSLITGTVNITSNPPGYPEFSMNKIKNQTTGGSISIQKPGLVNIVNDTLQLAAFNVNYFKSNSASDFVQNSFTGTVNISDSTGNNGGSYFRKNTINGNTSYTINSAAGFYEAFQGGNTYNGNTSFVVSGGTNLFYLGYDNKSTFNGNLNVSRTVAGTSYLLHQGFNALTGNFTYTNNIGGDTYINQVNGSSPKIGGTINITADGGGNPVFLMRKTGNLTTGGILSIQKPGLVTIENDTLLLSAFNVNYFKSASTSDFIQNSITGTVNISDSTGNSGGSYFRRNTINGNTNYTVNSTSGFYEAFEGGNIYNGNSSFIVSGSTNSFYLCYDNKSTFNGNLNVSRTVAGTSYLLHQGFNALTGNFTYTNSVGGATYINQGNVLSPKIGGTINITADGGGNPVFLMRRIGNLTTGGNLSVQKSGQITFENDTLQLTALNVNFYESAGTSDFIQNSITGSVSISDSAGNSGGSYFRRNTINGNMNYTNNSTSVIYESYLGGNTYNGNIELTRNNGTIWFAYDNPTNVNQNLTFNASAGLLFTAPIKFGGSSNGTIEQLGTQVITIPTFVMEKTGGARVTLLDSITIGGTATFTSGHIHTSPGANLIFPDNISYTGASAASHVIGPVTKIGDDAFIFPIGGPVSLNTLRMSAPVGLTSRFLAEYKQQNPTIDGFSTASKAGTFGAALISNAGYWDVQRLSGATNVTLTLGFGTNPYEEYPILANLKVAHWNGTQWDDHGNGGTTGTAASGTVVNSVPITSFSPFAIAGVIPTYFFSFGQPGPGPDGTPLKLKGIGGYPAFTVKQLPGGAYTSDSIFLVANGSTTSFRLKDLYGVEKDTTITTPASPVNYASANGSGTVNFTGWRHFVYMRDAGNNMMGAIKDNDLTLGNTTMNTYFSTASVATSPNGNIYLKRSFRITSQFAPVGIKRVRFYIAKTEFNNLVAADPTSFPGGINSLTITKYTGPMEDSLFSPQPGGNAVIIPNSAITIVDMGTMYSLDIDVDGFSGFYIGGNNMNLNLCSGSTITLPSNISGATYQWQVDNGGGFANIANGGIYSGVTTSALTITNPPNAIYGYKYRALINGVTPSQEYTIKLNISWTGAVSTAWESVANWSCGVLPTDNNDVIINGGRPNYPQLNSNASIRSLRVNPGATVTVKTGFTLTVKK